MMTVVAGILSSFMAFVFVYSQDPIVANLSAVQAGATIKVTVDGHEDLTGDYVVDDGTISWAVWDGGRGRDSAHGMQVCDCRTRLATAEGMADAHVLVQTGSIPATFGVFAVGLIGGALVNLGYAAYVLTRNKSWNVLFQSGRELALAVLIGIDFSLAVALMGKGMLLLGALGASVGCGIQQAMQMTGTQLLGFVSGEWRGVHGKPRQQMYLAIAILFVAAV